LREVKTLVSSFGAGSSKFNSSYTHKLLFPLIYSFGKVYIYFLNLPVYYPNPNIFFFIAQNQVQVYQLKMTLKKVLKISLHTSKAFDFLSWLSSSASFFFCEMHHFKPLQVGSGSWGRNTHFFSAAQVLQLSPKANNLKTLVTHSIEINLPMYHQNNSIVCSENLCLPILSNLYSPKQQKKILKHKAYREKVLGRIICQLSLRYPV